MIQFPCLPRSYLFCSVCRDEGYAFAGLPHSESLGSLLTRSSPRRIVAWSRPSSARHAKASTVCLLALYFSFSITQVSLLPSQHRPTSRLACEDRRAEHFTCHLFSIVNVLGGAVGIRNPDLRRAKAALSQLSYSPARWAILDSNQGPHPYQGCALTT